MKRRTDRWIDIIPVMHSKLRSTGRFVGKGRYYYIGIECGNNLSLVK